MEVDWPADCRFAQIRRKCRCLETQPRACRSRPSRHNARSWVPAPGVVLGGVGTGVVGGSGSGLCPRPSTEPAPQAQSLGRPSTAPVPGQSQGPANARNGLCPRRRGSLLGNVPPNPVPPALPETPEEQLDSWICSSTRLAASLKNAVGPAGPARGRPPQYHEGGGRRVAPVDDEGDVHDSLRDNPGRPPLAKDQSPQAYRLPLRPPTMDDGSVRSSIVTAASMACSSVAITANVSSSNSRTVTATVTATTTDTAATSQDTSLDTSRTASLQGLPAGPRLGVEPRGRTTDAFDDMDPLCPLGPLAMRTFQDDSQGSDMILPVRVEAGTDPVVELEPSRGKRSAASAQRAERSRKRRRDGRRRLPSRYRVPLYDYHPMLQAMQGRRSRSEGGGGGGQRTLGTRAAEQGGEPNGGGGVRQPQAAAESRRRRLERLAQPNFRHNSRINRTYLRPNLSVGPDPIWPISRAALRALPTPRVSRLSMAPARRSELRADISRSRSTAAHASGSVTSRMSARLEALSKPRLAFGRGQIETGTTGGAQRRLMTEAEWKRHREWLRVNAQPRKDYSLEQQRKFRRGRSASLRRLLPRLRVLATPPQRPTPREPHLKTVSQGALGYQASKRIIQLSQPLQRRLSTITR